MYDSYLIEVRDNAAGILVRNGRRFQFLATDTSLSELDGRLFVGPFDAERAVLKLIARRSVTSARSSKLGQ